MIMVQYSIPVIWILMFQIKDWSLSRVHSMLKRRHKRATLLYACIIWKSTRWSMLVSYCLSWPDLVFDIRHQYATVFASLHFCSVWARTLSSRISESKDNPIFVDDDITWRLAAAQEYWFERGSAESRHRDRCQQARGRWLGRCGLATQIYFGSLFGNWFRRHQIHNMWIVVYLNESELRK